MRKSFYRLHNVNQFYSSVEKKIYRQQEGEYMFSVGFASIQTCTIAIGTDKCYLLILVGYPPQPMGTTTYGEYFVVNGIMICAVRF